GGRTRRLPAPDLRRHTQEHAVERIDTVDRPPIRLETFMKASGLVAGAALVALLLAGCGGDNSASVSVTTASGAGVANSVRGSATTSGGSSSASTVTTSGGTTTTPSFSGNKNSDFCNVARELTSSDFASSLNDANPDLKAGLNQINDALARAKNSAPSEIKGDVTTLADALKKYSDFLAKYDYDIAKITQAAQKDPTVLQQATDALSDPKIEQASSRIEAYATQVCGITTPSTS